MSGKIAVVGIGPGDLSQLTLAAKEQIEQSDILIGAQRMLAPFLRPGLQTYDLWQEGYEAVARLLEREQERIITVLAAGDVGFYSVATVLGGLTKRPLHLLPGISSLQYFAARIGLPWQEMAVLSLHGREQNHIGHILTHRHSFFLLGASPTVSELCAELCQLGLGELEVVVGERLSYADERITRATARELVGQNFASLAVLLVTNHLLGAGQPSWQTPGIPDAMFIRGEVPMTKELVRAASVCKLRLAPQHIVYDIGAGTGSVAVEMALQARAGRVYAIERLPAACQLVRQNARKFGAYNLEVIEAEAPTGLKGLPTPDRVFIGGAGGQLSSIVDVVLEKNPYCRLVITAILLESATEAVKVLQERGCQVEIVQLASAVGRPVPAGTMMLGQNPIYIITGERER